MTAAIPLSHHNCTQEGNLPGCIVKDDKLHEQCNQGRSGELDLSYILSVCETVKTDKQCNPHIVTVRV